MKTLIATGYSVSPGTPEELLERVRLLIPSDWHSYWLSSEILGSSREGYFSLTKGTDRAFILIAAL